MKRGANNLSEIDNSSHKKQKITKSLDVLLQEVNSGNFDDFRLFLNQENMTSLNLYQKASNIDLMQLGLALKDTQVHTLDLRDNNIGADGAKSLGIALKDTQVHTLNLGWNNIGAEGAKNLGAALKDTQVHTLNLGWNNIGADGAAHLGEALKDTQVQILELTGNDIGADGAVSLGAALKGTQVQILELTGNDIGDDGAARLGAALKGTKIHTLNLGENDIGENGAARLLAALKDTQVRTLTLWHNKIGNDGAARLAACIPDTLLFNIELSFQNAALEAALKKNHWEKRLSPYYIASLQHLPDNEKNQYYNLPAVSAETKFAGGFLPELKKAILSHVFPEASAKTAALQYAGGIFMGLGQRGLPELQNKILSYLPGVSPTLAYQYQSATEKAAKNKIQASSVEGMDIENSKVNSNRLC